MDAEHIAVATRCMDAAHRGTLSFPQIVGALIDAGFEGYAVDYRRNSQIFYRPDGDSVTLDAPMAAAQIAAPFDSAEVAASVRWAQADGPDYSYSRFNARVTAAGCAGYLVSFSGRRVVYYGRTAETHVEHFPQ